MYSDKCHPDRLWTTSYLSQENVKNDEKNWNYHPLISCYEVANKFLSFLAPRVILTNSYFIVVMPWQRDVVFKEKKCIQCIFVEHCAKALSRGCWKVPHIYNANVHVLNFVPKISLSGTECVLLWALILMVLSTSHIRSCFNRDFSFPNIMIISWFSNIITIVDS